MAPGASIGAAEPIPAHGVKMISGLRGEFESTAQRNHHDARSPERWSIRTSICHATSASGAILTLNTDDAVALRHRDRARRRTLDAALAQLDLAGAPRVTESFTWGEQLARFATDPAVSGLLLTLGMLGLLDRDADAARHRRV